MPIYEFRCSACRKKTTVLTLRVSEAVDPVCEHCGSRTLTRLMSRFAMVRSEEDRIDSLSDPDALGGLDENDPKSMARWMRKMGDELGEDLGDDFDEMVEEMDAGDGDQGDDTSDGGTGGEGDL
ncbi:MAG: zinc ribbon domain-containing protein [Candidatus Binatia bacterium]